MTDPEQHRRPHDRTPDGAPAEHPQQDREPARDRDARPPADDRPAPRAEKDPLRRSRTGGTYVGLVVAGVLLVFLIVFVAQNTQSVRIEFFVWSGQVPLAVALLAASIGGLLVAGLVGALRIWQLRRRVKHEVKARR